MIDSSGFNEAWSEHHGFLLDVAYRLLGSYGDAEDIVQEAFSRLLRTDLDPIEDVRAWLVVVVSRLCLDQLRSARVRHESYIGPWFPEPLLQLEADSADPADVVTLDESVRMAMLIVLERMSPAERVVFVLHDIFEFPFEKVAEMVDRTPAACRQLASRARRRVKAEDANGRLKLDRVGPQSQRGTSESRQWRHVFLRPCVRFDPGAAQHQRRAWHCRLPRRRGRGRDRAHSESRGDHEGLCSGRC
ncbi:MAG: sigma-70 family RNA polymerase sigma factor [Chloroflexi bacterium]|nr:MAG: sigma-70 family RNA polymerase sigma factor [Chloroflexota bacterium]